MKNSVKLMMANILSCDMNKLTEIINVQVTLATETYHTIFSLMKHKENSSNTWSDETRGMAVTLHKI